MVMMTPNQTGSKPAVVMIGSRIGAVIRMIAAGGMKNPHTSRKMLIRNINTHLLTCMDITGDPTGQPTRIGVAFADVFTGVYSALAITAALKERDSTGKGSHIDMVGARGAAVVFTEGAISTRPGTILSWTKPVSGFG